MPKNINNNATRATTTTTTTVTATPTLTMAKTKAKKETWANSKAKEMLREWIISGKVKSSMKPTQAHEMDPEFTKWKCVNFRTNLNSLHKAVAKDVKRMKRDVVAFRNDMDIIKGKRHQQPVPFFKSEAKKLLQMDLDDGMFALKQTKPKDLHESRGERKQRSLEEFRSFIYKELKAREKKEAGARSKKKKFRGRKKLVPSDELLSECL